MSGFQSPITIANAIDRINRKEYLLPAFQREFVWSTTQIEMLFDSIMKGYPISSMLFWKVKGNTKTDFRFYSFLNKYIQYHSSHNEITQTASLNDFHAILDGQQRLTALYLGLCGSYAYKLPRKHYTYSEQNYPTRHLYLNISCVLSSSDTNSEKTFDFQFKDKISSKEDDLFYDKNNHKWFKVSRILSLHKGDDYDIDDFCDDNDITKEEKKVIKKLDKTIHDHTNINFYEEDDQAPDKAVNIFVRINSGGTSLSFSDILLSIAVANWKNKDARTEIHNLVDNVNSIGFNITKDYILKSFLYLYHNQIKTQINSFNSGFSELIEDNWEKIRDAIISLFNLLRTYGITDYSLTSYNATLPILYYIYHKDIYNDFADRVCYAEDRKIIKQWLLSILIRRTFGASADNVLTQSRKAFFKGDDGVIGINEDISLFPAVEINKKIKNFSEIGDDYIESLLLTQKGSKYSFSILASLYPNMDYKNNNFHQDHLHPASSYNSLSDKNSNEYGWEVYNSILNLQMLDANENESKGATPLSKWVYNQTDSNSYNNFLTTHLIPKVNLDLENFGEYIEARKKDLIQRLKFLLN